MAQTLDKVKQVLGSDAVILHTRTLRKGGVLGVGSKTVVEITATRDASLLHPAERRAVSGRQSEIKGGSAGYRPAAPRSPVHFHRSRNLSSVRSTVPADDATARVDASEFTAALQSEMNELRTMVRELLNRPATLPSPEAAGADLPQELRTYYTGLIQNQVAGEIATEVMVEARERLKNWRERCQVSDSGQDQMPASQHQALCELIPEVLVETIERMLPACDPLQIDSQNTPRYVALVGPTGVGKTTTIAKLAAHFKLREGKRVGLITVDTYRIAAVEQLKAYADILSVPLEVVMTQEEMAEALMSMSNYDIVFIDTSGRSQRDEQRLVELKEFLDAAREAGRRAIAKNVSRRSASKGRSRRRSRGPDGRFRASQAEAPVSGGDPLDVHLVLSCTADPTHLLEVAEKFAALGVTRVVFTKLDEAVGLGVILNVVRRLNLQLSYLTTGQDVPDDIEIGHRRRIAELVLGRSAIGSAAATRSPAMTSSVDHLA